MNDQAKEFFVIWTAQGQLIMSAVHSPTDDLTILEWLRLAYFSESVECAGEPNDDDDLDDYLEGPLVNLDAVLYGPVAFVIC
jgi:hypothetical protein